jgi:threonine/homoserine/homoserine lactone efflux protein
MGRIDLIAFVSQVVLLSLSGVLMPGPVTAVTLARGSRDPHAGAWVALGHGVLEWPLMALMYFGVGELFKYAPVKVGIGIAGGLIMLWMGIGMLRDLDPAGALAEPGPSAERSPFLAGILLSAGNPYFLIWWATAGAVLVQRSLTFGIIGFFILAAAHWLCDFVWYYFLSALSFRGGKFFGRRLQRGVFVVCGLFLLYFSGYFAAKAVLELLS